MTDDHGRRRRRRRRSPESEPAERDRPVPKPPEPAHKPGPPAKHATPAPPGANTRRAEHTPGPRVDKSERSLRGLVGSGPSQVGVSAAMRARDAARPEPADMDAAERDLTIVRRHYEPHDSGSAPNKCKR